MKQVLLIDNRVIYHDRQMSNVILLLMAGHFRAAARHMLCREPSFRGPMQHINWLSAKIREGALSSGRHAR